MKTIFTILIFTFLLTESSVYISPGTAHSNALEQLGKPAFEYENIVNNFDSNIKFNVTGWEKEDVWYGTQAVNDTITAFFVFKDKKNYLEYIKKQ